MPKTGQRPSAVWEMPNTAIMLVRTRGYDVLPGRGSPIASRAKHPRRYKRWGGPEPPLSRRQLSWPEPPLTTKERDTNIRGRRGIESRKRRIKPSWISQRTSMCRKEAPISPRFLASPCFPGSPFPFVVVFFANHRRPRSRPFADHSRQWGVSSRASIGARVILALFLLGMAVRPPQLTSFL